MTDAYVDGFVIPVPAHRKDEYQALAAKAAAIVIEHGATEVAEHWCDDPVSLGDQDFAEAVCADAKDGVVLSWIAWASRDSRDRGMKAIANDPRLAAIASDPLFNNRRMISGGFARMLHQTRP